MTHRDPIEQLSSYYGCRMEATPRDEMIANVFANKAKKRQRIFAATGGFAVTAAVAAVLLAWAALPSKSNRNDTASAIARYQMINSGLVEAPRTNGQVPR